MTTLNNLKFNQPPTKIAILVGVFVWVVLVVFLLARFATSQLNLFDQNQIILSAYQSPDNYLAALKNNLPNAQPNSLIRIEAQGCRCNKRTEQHWALLQEQNPSVNFVTMNLKDLSAEMQALVPSSPMALFMNTESELLYAGPFSAGLSCNTKTSFLDDYVEGSLTLKHVPFGVEGCYCTLL